MYVISINLTEFWSYRIVLLVNLFGLFCCVQVEYPVYWTYSEWTEGFKRLLDFLHLDEVSTEPNIKKTCSIRLSGSCFISSCFLWALNFLILRLSQHYFQVQIHTDFHHFTEISQLFHNKHIFNNNGTFQVEIWKMVRTNVFFLQFPVIRCPSMNQKSGKGNFRELKSKKIHRGACPQGPLEACSRV